MDLENNVMVVVEMELGGAVDCLMRMMRMIEKEKGWVWGKIREGGYGFGRMEGRGN